MVFEERAKRPDIAQIFSVIKESIAYPHRFILSATFGQGLPDGMRYILPKMSIF
jgi:hypothetical protein